MARSKKQKGKIRIGFFIAIAAFICAFAFFYWKFNRPSYVHYPAFGIPIPTNYAIHGIDVSRYQKNIGWKLVKEMEIDGISIDFVFIKATEGLGGVDVQFARNWINAGEQELHRGAYHFFVPGKNGKTQAQNFIKTVKLSKGDLPPVLDIEETYGVKKEALLEQLQHWVKAVEDYYKVKPIIYTNVSFYEKYLAGTFDHYPLWIAHYKQPGQPRINRHWHFWQHSETGRVNGIEAFVDFNVFNGNSIAFENLLIR
ncbi:MAG TPA: GH25 family lysozyme [Ferruginibacter sp.]|nr:GH25 family lysozyme [Ferruginibacter sp.]HRE63577.1 GH25 family lysozyme [Ferruginibacter sp.]